MPAQEQQRSPPLGSTTPRRTAIKDRPVDQDRLGQNRRSRRTQPLVPIHLAHSRDPQSARIREISQQGLDPLGLTHAVEDPSRLQTPCRRTRHRVTRLQQPAQPERGQAEPTPVDVTRGQAVGRLATRQSVKEAVSYLHDR